MPHCDTGNIHCWTLGTGVFKVAEVGLGFQTEQSCWPPATSGPQAKHRNSTGRGVTRGGLWASRGVCVDVMSVLLWAHMWVHMYMLFCTNARPALAGLTRLLISRTQTQSPASVFSCVLISYEFFVVFHLLFRLCYSFSAAFHILRI